MNKWLAKHLSKHVSGFGGMLLHFFIISFIMGVLLNAVPLIFSLVMMGNADALAAEYTDSDMAALGTMLQAGQLGEIVKAYPELVAMQVAPLLVLLTGPISFIWSIILTLMRSKYYSDAKAAKKAGNSGVFGSARYATEPEARAAGLIGAGVVFGSLGKTLIEKPPTVEGHVLVVGGTGTGKSRGVVIPTLFRWPGAALVVDIKGELSRITGDRRKTRGRMFVFDPAGGGGDRYDPVAACTTIDAAQDLARTLIPPPQSGEPFFANCAQAIVAAYLYEGAAQRRYLSDIAETLCMEPIKELVEHCRSSAIREVRLLASVAYDMPEKTLGNVVSEIKSHLITLASDETLRRATTGSDWTMADLETGTTIYLKVPEHLLEQYKTLWTAIIAQALRHLSKRTEQAQPPILVCLDEMPRLSAINGLTSALATLRSRNVHILGVVQSMAQLDAIYGQDSRKVIADNCRYKYVLSATDPETQKYFSDLAGQHTVLSRSESGNFLPSQSRNEAGAPLIRPEDWAHLTQPVLLAPKLYPAKLDFVWWDKVAL